MFSKKKIKYKKSFQTKQRTYGWGNPNPKKKKHSNFPHNGKKSYKIK